MLLVILERGIIVDNNFLQMIKLEIGRSLRLTPYERIAFHKVLGIRKSNDAISVLRKDLFKGPAIRSSAIRVLSTFSQPEVVEELKKYLLAKVTNDEKMMILESIINFGSSQDVPLIMSFIDTIDNENPPAEITEKAFRTLRTISIDDEDAFYYLISKIDNSQNHEHIRTQAILALSSFSDSSKFEEILKEEDEILCYYAFLAITILNRRMADIKKNARDKDDLFTYSDIQTAKNDPELRIRVLLGSVAPNFDSYSINTKIAFIGAMMTCNHREYNTYVAKALASEKQELITGTLYALLRNIEYLEDPDKLFRNLIFVSIESPKENDLIVEIFAKFFSAAKDDRKYNILRERVFGYITITMQNDFETYSKEYMFRNVVEKNYTEGFQIFRKFLFEYMNPELKQDIIDFLTKGDPEKCPVLIEKLSKHIHYIPKSEDVQVKSLLDTLFVSDENNRNNSILGIEDINYEKRYLRNRIARLCRIIGALKIEGAASSIVNSYNYMKKYPDNHLSLVMENTLAQLKYSYLLGEIEIFLFTGTKEEQEKGLRLIAHFNEQQSMNILFEYIKRNYEDNSNLLQMALKIVLGYDLYNNISANDIFKTIITSNENDATCTLAIIGMGHCGFENEIPFFNDLFYTRENRGSKIAALRAMGRLTPYVEATQKNRFKKYFVEYLKDQSINVRIYANLFLVMLDDQNASRAIREMLVIKNKSIQQELVSIIAKLRSLDFSFFLISLMTEEYGISNDIIEALKLLQKENIREIETFVINLFRKYDEQQDDDSSRIEQIEVKNLKQEELILLNCDIIFNDFKKLQKNVLSEAIDRSLLTTSLVSDTVSGNQGYISVFTNDRVIACFKDIFAAVKTSIAISEKMRESNQLRNEGDQIVFINQILKTDVLSINDEMLYYPSSLIDDLNEKIFQGKTILDVESNNAIGEEYITAAISNLMLPDKLMITERFDVRTPQNFKTVALNYFTKLKNDADTKQQAEEALKEEIKNMYMSTSPSQITMAGKLENISFKLLDNFNTINHYLQTNSVDQKLNENINKMLTKAYDMFKMEISRLIIK